MAERLDTTELRTRALAMLCASKTQVEIRTELARDLGVEAGNAELTAVVRQLAEGRRALLRPGRYRPRARARRRVS